MYLYICNIALKLLWLSRNYIHVHMYLLLETINNNKVGPINMKYIKKQKILASIVNINFQRK